MKHLISGIYSCGLCKCCIIIRFEYQICPLIPCNQMLRKFLISMNNVRKENVAFKLAASLTLESQLLFATHVRKYTHTDRNHLISSSDRTLHTHIIPRQLLFIDNLVNKATNVTILLTDHTRLSTRRKKKENKFDFIAINIRNENKS